MPESPTVMRLFDAIETMCWQTPAPVLIDAFVSLGLAPLATAGVGVGDPSATRTVYTTVVVLVVLGLVLAALAVWVLRRTVPEPELLAPLETMDTRSWRKLDPAGRRRALDDSRPPGALPLRREASEPAVDESFSTLAPVASFDDLSERADQPLASPSSSPADDPGGSEATGEDRAVDHGADDGDHGDEASAARADTGESDRVDEAVDGQGDDSSASEQDTGEIERAVDRDS